MMATSAAAVSYNMGMYQNNMDTVRDIQVILGFNMGKSLVAQPTQKGPCTSIILEYILPLIIQCLIVAPLFLLPVVQMSLHGDLWKQVLVGTTLVTTSCLILVAIIPTGKKNPGFMENIVRWCVVHIQQVRLIREISGVMNYGPTPPPILSLSDGGHVENLGLLPLLKRRCERILVVDGGYHQTDTMMANDLIIALQLARKWLHCSFSGQDGRDIIEDIKNKFTNKQPGIQPRTYNFKVEYFERPYGCENDVKTGEGQILVLLPRHPFKGSPSKWISTWDDYTDDTDQDLDPQLWGLGPELCATETDKLTFCCCKCCHHTFCRTFSSFGFGLFPQHFTFNQFFTPEMFSVYHREGYRASVDGEIERFLDANIKWPRDNPIIIQRLNLYDFKESSMSSSDMEQFN